MKLLKNEKAVLFFAIIATFAWGCAFPLIKLGMEAFQIAPGDTGSKTVFAGIRFLISGIVLLVIARCNRRSFHMEKQDFAWVSLFALVNTALAYFCFYIGVSNSEGSRASVLNAMSTFLLVFLACIFFEEEHMSKKKVLGCILGFAGILLLNLGGSLGAAFHWNGDGMMMLNAICSAFGGILTRIVCKRIDAVVATGCSLSIGGAMLMASGGLMGGHISTVNGKGIVIMALLVAISSVAFYIYNQLMRYHSVGKVAIYNALIPVFGILMSCFLLGETFSIKYVLAGLFVAAGVWTINYER